MARGIPGYALALLFAVSVHGQEPNADLLRAHVFFLASDALEGRSAPSWGLDVAATYIATQFKLAGLEPAGDDGYFQTANLEDLGARGQQLLKQAEPGTPHRLRNVAGILRGSDPALRDTFVMLTAHYDHLPPAKDGEDRIFNGANDDASGTASVLEIARALSALPVHPKRSVLFVAFFGEERGLLGSRYYAQHPLVDPVKTIADLNLEQVGRTDGEDGPQIKTASITGFDFSELPGMFVTAGEALGVYVYKNPEASDRYFARSDNQALADLGIPAHTLCVAFEFPDYHKVSDTWDKIDYNNMAVVDKLVAVGIREIANSPVAPRWNEDYAPAKKYVDAAAKLHGSSSP